jgi:hypothetical protein
MSKKIWPTSQSVKKALNKSAYPNSAKRFFPDWPVEGNQEILRIIWERLKPTHTCKQTIRIMNQMTRDELEAECARYILERSEG